MNKCTLPAALHGRLDFDFSFRVSICQLPAALHMRIRDTHRLRTTKCAAFQPYCMSYKSVKEFEL